MSWNQAEDGPYDFARERYEALADDRGDWIWINGHAYDSSEVPSRSDLAEEDAAMRRSRR